jgi:molecular chaperone DnaK (HSP70)
MNLWKLHFPEGRYYAVEPPGATSVSLAVPVQNVGRVAVELAVTQVGPHLKVSDQTRTLSIGPAEQSRLVVEVDAANLKAEGNDAIAFLQFAASARTAGERLAFYIPKTSEPDGITIHHAPGAAAGNTGSDAKPVYNLGLLDASQPGAPTIWRDFTVLVDNAGGTPLVLALRPLVSDDRIRIRVNTDDRTVFVPPYGRMIEVPLRASANSTGEHVQRVAFQIRQATAESGGWQWEQEFDIAASVSRPPEPRVLEERVGFGEVVMGQTRLRRFTIVNDGDRPFRIERILPDKETIQVLRHPRGEVTPGSHGQYVEVLLNTRHPDAEVFRGVGRASGRIQLELAGGGVSSLAVPWEASVFVPRRTGGTMAVDFGTVNSCVAFLPDTVGAKPEIVTDRDGKETFPSLLLFLAGTHECFLYGKEAQRRVEITKSAEGVVQCVKRAIDSDRSWEIHGRRYTGTELAALLIEQLLLEAILRYKAEPERLAITLPAAFWGVKRNRLLEACAKAWQAATGRKLKMQCVDEPTAVAFHYMKSCPEELDSIEPGESRYFLVFDFGGGTLDISVVRVGKAEGDRMIIQPIVARGDNRLGGTDLDVSLLTNIALGIGQAVPAFHVEAITDRKQDFLRRLAGHPQWAMFQNQRMEWYNEARRAKEDLSAHSPVPFPSEDTQLLLLDRDGKPVRTEGDDGSIVAVRETLTSTQFRQIIAPNLDRAKALVTAALDYAGLKRHEVHRVLLTGQSSLIPMVRTTLDTFFPGRLADVADCPLKTSVAKGAAVASVLIAHDARKTGEAEGMHEVRSLDRTSYRYGIGVPVHAGTKLRFIEIIGSGQPIHGARGETSISRGAGGDPDAFRLLSVVQNGRKGDGYLSVDDPDVEVIGTLDISDVPPGETLVGLQFDPDGGTEAATRSNEGRLVATINRKPHPMKSTETMGVYL